MSVIACLTKIFLYKIPYNFMQIPASPSTSGTTGTSSAGIFVSWDLGQNSEFSSRYLADFEPVQVGLAWVLKYQDTKQGPPESVSGSISQRYGSGYGSTTLPYSVPVASVLVVADSASSSSRRTRSTTFTTR